MISPAADLAQAQRKTPLRQAPGRIVVFTHERTLPHVELGPVGAVGLSLQDEGRTGVSLVIRGRELDELTVLDPMLLAALQSYSDDGRVQVAWFDDDTKTQQRDARNIL